ncbi:MAG: universal stress protein [Planctomycetota bacterium]
MIKRILAGVCDPLYTASVARHTVDLAKRFNSNVTAISVTDIERLKNLGPVAVGSATWRHSMVANRIERNEDAIRQSLDVLTRLCDASNVDCDIVLAGGLPYEKLLEASRYHDLMVFGLKGLFEHGVVAEPPNELVHLIESGVQPILAAGPEYREIKKVLVAYSGSVESAKTIRTFNQINLWPDAEIKAINIGKRGSKGPVLLTEIREYFAAHGKDVEIEFIEGSAKNELLPAADDWQADLIVVGNSAKSLLRRRVFGETALKVIGESSLPLFLSQ